VQITVQDPEAASDLSVSHSDNADAESNLIRGVA
jgi:hypothetical protein